MALRERFFAADSNVICDALEGCRRIFDSVAHAPKDDDYTEYWVLVGKSYEFTEEEVYDLLQGKLDQIIIGLLFHPDPQVNEKAREAVLMADHLVETIVATILCKAPKWVRGMKTEEKRDLLVQFMNRPRSLR
jgi:hypothetical protein